MAATLEAGSSRANDVLDRLPEVKAKLVGLGLFPVGTCGADFSASPRKIEVRWQSAAAEPNPRKLPGSGRAICTLTWPNRHDSRESCTLIGFRIGHRHRLFCCGRLIARVARSRSARWPTSRTGRPARSQRCAGCCATSGALRSRPAQGPYASTTTPAFAHRCRYQSW